MASDRIRRDLPEKIVILDTNALLMLFEFSIDLRTELLRLVGKHHVVIPSPVFQELVRLTEQGDGRKQMNAKAALQFIKDFEQIDTRNERGDDAVVFLAQQLQGIVVTNDKELRRRLKEYNLPVIFLRKKQTLCME